MTPTYTTDECLLRRYLDRYRNMQNRKRYLQRKLKDIQDDFDASAFRAKQTDGVSGGGSAESNVPGYILSKERIMADIVSRTNEASTILEDIQSIIYLLPDDSQEQIALDAKYISRMSIYEICDLLYVSRPTAYRIVDRGIKALLLIPEVNAKVAQYGLSLLKQSETP